MPTFKPSATNEFKAASSISLIFSCRMLGLFMILPIFALYADKIRGATPTLIGLALGIYGFTQAILQIPLGMLSDHWGRKHVIICGLLLFIVGSLLAAFSTTIYGIIIGRALQGAGAIGSTLLALLSDLTRVENRTKAMGILGMTIGLSFIFAMMIGPIINKFLGLQGIFLVTAVLGVFAISIISFYVPNPPRRQFHADTQLSLKTFKKNLRNTNLLRLNFGIFTLHATLTASFIAIPLTLENLGLAEDYQWLLYVPILVIAFISMIPLIIFAEKKRQLKPILLFSISLLIMAELFLWWGHRSLIVFGIAMLFFFTAFSTLEASLPSLVSKIAPSDSKGTALGIYSSSQFLGIFAGGSIGGWLFTELHDGLLIACAGFAMLWLIVAATMPKPPHVKTILLDMSQLNSKKAHQLTQRFNEVTGIMEVSVLADNGLAYLKIDDDMITEQELSQIRDAYVNPK